MSYSRRYDLVVNGTPAHQVEFEEFNSTRKSVKELVSFEPDPIWIAEKYNGCRKLPSLDQFDDFRKDGKKMKAVHL